MNIKSLFLKMCYAVFRILPVKKNKVLIFSYYGEQYSGSPKYISKYLENKSDISLVWAFTDQNKHREYNGKSVHYYSISYYYHLATCTTVITNYRMTEDFKKRSYQRYIQTWHSSLRLKMIENDAKDTLPQNYIKMAKSDSKQIDFLLSGSEKSREIFQRAFWYCGEILKCGTPSCDILFSDRTPYREKVGNMFNIPSGANIALYAPTFRKDHNTDVYDISPEDVRESLKKRFGGEWYILMRLHPHLVGKLDCFEYTDKILQATKYDDVQELLCAADFLISDYSAIMFDFALTKRPCVLYTPDLEQYVKKDRQLYFEIDNLPFKHFNDKKSLLEGIEDFSYQTYKTKTEKFLSDIGSYDDGHASQRVYEIIIGEKNEYNRVYNGGL